MTNQETIANLNMIKVAFVDPVTKEQRKLIDDTFDNAIKKLEQEPKTGHWISFGVQGEVDGQIVQVFTCSECGAISIFRLSSGNIVNGDICPNCGAKMYEPQESEDKE